MTDYWQNVSNDWTIGYLKDLGAENVTYSPECDIRDLGAGGYGILEVPVYGKMDLMNIYHSIKSIRYEDLLDDKIEIESNGNSFGFRMTYFGDEYLRLVNGRTLYIKDLDIIKKKGISGIRLMLTGEDDIASVVDAYYRSFILDKDADELDVKEFTRGHLLKGVD